MHIRTMAVSTALALGLLMYSTTPSAGTAVTVPLSCSKGPSGQTANLSITVPRSVAEGATFTVRIDGKDSGKISHTGLKYIHSMTTELVIPAGTTLVSARVVPDTGTANVRPGAKVVTAGSTLALVLPARVEDGSSYTPPSFEFQLKVTATAGTAVVQKFSQYRVTANAIIIGDVRTVCDPTPKPYSIATTTVTTASPPTPPPAP
jgi:hypothetical protein